MIFYIQLTYSLFLCLIVMLELLRLIVEKQINKVGETYKQEDLLVIYEDGKKTYNLSVDLDLKKEGFPSYNPITKILTFDNKDLFSKTEYLTFLHELAHAIDFNRKKTDNLAKMKLIAASSSILFCLISGVLLFLNDHQAGIGAQLLMLVFSVGLVFGFFGLFFVHKFM